MKIEMLKCDLCGDLMQSATDADRNIRIVDSQYPMDVCTRCSMRIQGALEAEVLQINSDLQAAGKFVIPFDLRVYATKEVKQQAPVVTSIQADKPVVKLKQTQRRSYMLAKGMPLAEAYSKCVPNDTPLRVWNWTEGEDQFGMERMYIESQIIIGLEGCDSRRVASVSQLPNKPTADSLRLYYKHLGIEVNQISSRSYRASFANLIIHSRSVHEAVSKLICRAGFSGYTSPSIEKILADYRKANAGGLYINYYDCGALMLDEASDEQAIYTWNLTDAENSEVAMLDALVSARYFGITLKAIKAFADENKVDLSYNNMCVYAGLTGMRLEGSSISGWSLRFAGLETKATMRMGFFRCFPDMAGLLGLTPETSLAALRAQHLKLYEAKSAKPAESTKTANPAEAPLPPKSEKPAEQAKPTEAPLPPKSEKPASKERPAEKPIERELSVAEKKAIEMAKIATGDGRYVVLYRNGYLRRAKTVSISQLTGVAAYGPEIHAWDTKVPHFRMWDMIAEALVLGASDEGIKDFVDQAGDIYAYANASWITLEVRKPSGGRGASEAYAAIFGNRVGVGENFPRALASLAQRMGYDGVGDSTGLNSFSNLRLGNKK